MLLEVGMFLYLPSALREIVLYIFTTSSHIACKITTHLFLIDSREICLQANIAKLFLNKHVGSEVGYNMVFRVHNSEQMHNL